MSMDRHTHLRLMFTQLRHQFELEGTDSFLASEIADALTLYQSAIGLRENQPDNTIEELISAFQMMAEDIEEEENEEEAEEAARLREQSRIRPTIPADFPVQPLKLCDWRTAKVVAECGVCGRCWDDDIPTSYTPAPSGRCPFEEFH